MPHIVYTTTRKYPGESCSVSLPRERAYWRRVCGLDRGVRAPRLKQENREKKIGPFSVIFQGRRRRPFQVVKPETCDIRLETHEHDYGWQSASTRTKPPERTLQNENTRFECSRSSCSREVKPETAIHAEPDWPTQLKGTRNWAASQPFYSRSAAVSLVERLRRRRRV